MKTKQISKQSMRSIFSLAVVLSILFVTVFTGCSSKSGGSKSGYYEKDPMVYKEMGIQNCHGYTWWMLTGTCANSKRANDIETELIRRKYKPFPYKSGMNLDTGDVIVFKKWLDHSGIVVVPGTLSHFRSTSVQEIFRDPHVTPGELNPVARNLIIPPDGLYSYPAEYETWLKQNSPDPEKTKQEILEKKEKLSIGFWHNADTMQEVKTLLYPKNDPEITIWKLPKQFIIDPVKAEIYDFEDKQYTAWFIYSATPDRINITENTSIKIYWNEIGEPEIIKDGLAIGSDLKIGENIIKASTKIVQPWSMYSDAVKEKNIGQDNDKWLESEATLIVKDGNSELVDVTLSIDTFTDPPYESGCTIRFAANVNLENNQLPENIRWEWDWGDGEKDTVKGQPHTNRLNNETGHYYQYPGPFTATVQLIDDDTGGMIINATKSVIIDNLQAIQRTTWVRAQVQVFNLQEIYRLRDGEWTKTGDFNTFSWIGINGRGYELKWNGNNFSVSFGDGIQSSKFTITGKVSEDGAMVETVTTTEEYTNKETNHSSKKVMILENVPLEKFNCGDSVTFRLLLEGADAVQEYLKHYEYESKGPEQIDKHVGFDWNYQDQQPKLEVEFSAME